MNLLKNLTPDKEQELMKFVLKCVASNAVLESTARFGRVLNLTVQELFQSNVQTLRDVGTQIVKQEGVENTNEFAKDGELKISGIPTKEWKQLLHTLIELKEAEAISKKNEAEIARLEKELVAFETPEEKKSKIEQRLAELKGTGVPEAATAEA